MIRADDKPEVVKDRLVTYHKQTAPLKDYYNAKGKLTLVNGNDSIDAITEKISSAVDGIRG